MGWDQFTGEVEEAAPEDADMIAALESENEQLRGDLEQALGDLELLSMQSPEEDIYDQMTGFREQRDAARMFLHRLRAQITDYLPTPEPSGCTRVEDPE